MSDFKNLSLGVAGVNLMSVSYSDSHLPSVDEQEDVCRKLERAYYACHAVPKTIKPGAVVAMAEQLEAAKRLQEKHYGDATELHMAMLMWAEGAQAALALYRGEENQ